MSKAFGGVWSILQGGIAIYTQFVYPFLYPVIFMRTCSAPGLAPSTEISEGLCPYEAELMFQATNMKYKK